MTGPTIDVKIIDKFSAELKKLDVQLKKVSDSVKKSSESTSKSTEKTASNIKKAITPLDKLNKQAKEFSKTFFSLQKQVGKGAALEQMGAQAKVLSSQFQRLGVAAPRSIMAIANASKVAVPAVKTLDLSVKGLVASLAPLLAFTSALRVVTAVIGRVEELTPLKQGFKTLTAEINTTSDSMLNSLRKATNSMVSDFELIKTANLGLTLGIAKTEEELATLAGGAVKLGKAIGLDAQSAVDSLFRALGRGSILILDNLGIVFKMKAAYEEYAESVGKTVNELTAEEQLIAFRTKAIAELDKRVKALGDTQESTAQQISSLGAAFDNVLTDAAESFESIDLSPLIDLIELLRPLLSLITDVISGIIQLISFITRVITETVKALSSLPFISELIQATGWVMEKFGEIISSTGDEAKDATPKINSYKKSIENLSAADLTNKIETWKEALVGLRKDQEDLRIALKNWRPGDDVSFEVLENKYKGASDAAWGLHKEIKDAETRVENLNFEKAQKAFADLVTPLTKLHEEAGELKLVFDKLIVEDASMETIAHFIGEDVKDLIQDFKDAGVDIPKVLEGLMTDLEGFVNFSKELFSTPLDALDEDMKKFLGVWKTLEKQTGKDFERMVKIMGKSAADIVKKAEELGSDVPPLIEAISNAYKDIEKATEDADNAQATFSDNLQRKAKEAKEAAKDLADEIKEWRKNINTHPDLETEEITEGWLDDVVYKGDKAFKGISEAVSAAFLSGIVDAIDSGDLSKLLSNAGASAGAMVGKNITKNMSEGMQQLGEQMGSVFGAILGEIASHMLEDLANVFSEGASDFEQAVERAINKFNVSVSGIVFDVAGSGLEAQIQMLEMASTGNIFDQLQNILKLGFTSFEEFYAELDKLRAIQEGIETLTTTLSLLSEEEISADNFQSSWAAAIQELRQEIIDLGFTDEQALNWIKPLVEQIREALGPDAQLSQDMQDLFDLVGVAALDAGEEIETVFEEVAKSAKQAMADSITSVLGFLDATEDALKKRNAVWNEFLGGGGSKAQLQSLKAIADDLLADGSLGLQEWRKATRDLDEDQRKVLRSIVEFRSEKGLLSEQENELLTAEQQQRAELEMAIALQEQWTEAVMETASAYNNMRIISPGFRQGDNLSGQGAASASQITINTDNPAGFQNYLASGGTREINKALREATSYGEI